MPRYTWLIIWLSVCDALSRDCKLDAELLGGFIAGEWMTQFDYRERRPAYSAQQSSLTEIRLQLLHGTTCRSIVERHLSRLEQVNPHINAMISMNPDALRRADELDVQMSRGNMTGQLFCVPVVVKDNIDAVGMNTTGGSLALSNLRPTKDASVVTALHRAGAVLLGKTNLHELALEGLSVSSLGGQTRNPWDLSRTPGGSSGGTAAAVVVGGAPLGLGTDTMNSVRSPASATGLFGMRPTRGLVSRVGVMPVSWTQDAVGPLALSPAELAVVMTALASAGRDPADTATLEIPDEALGTDYLAAMRAFETWPLRIGVVEDFIPDEHSIVRQRFELTVDTFTRSSRFEVVRVSSPIFNSTRLRADLDVQKFEFAAALATYLQRPESGTGGHPTNLAAVLDTNKVLVIPAQRAHMRACLSSSPADAEYATALEGITDVTAALEDVFVTHGVDALLYPHQAQLAVPVGAPSQAGRNGILAALTGWPSLAMPSLGTDEADEQIPAGVELLGRPWQEARLLAAAQVAWCESSMPQRRLRRWEETVKQYNKMPAITPAGTASVPSAYPLGFGE